MKMKDVLQATSFRFNKALGQNFISDTNLLKGIVTDSGITCPSAEKAAVTST